MVKKKTTVPQFEDSGIPIANGKPLGVSPWPPPGMVSVTLAVQMKSTLDKSKGTSWALNAAVLAGHGDLRSHAAAFLLGTCAWNVWNIRHEFLSAGGHHDPWKSAEQQYQQHVLWSPGRQFRCWLRMRELSQFQQQDLRCSSFCMFQRCFNDTLPPLFR